MNRALVRRYFGGEDPVGVRLSDFGPPGNTRRLSVSWMTRRVPDAAL